MGVGDPGEHINAVLPEQFGKYSLIGHLATGGVAEVWLARQVGLEGFEKTVVIKRARPELTDRETTRRFLDEARLVATLEHPNIVQVYEIGAVNGSYFFVMEYVDGADVRRLIETSIAKRYPIALADALYIIIHVCTALHYAHEKHDLEGNPLRIIHRDVSPSNVLISHDGVVKVCDFRIAKAHNRKVEDTQSVLKGKFSYMSPEQCQSKPIDRRSDVFSIGILLYELSTQSKLFRGTSDFTLLQQIVENPIPLPSARVPNYPRELQQLVMKALAKNPAERYPTAQALQLDLEEFAREHKLAMSSVRIARLMSALFEKRNDAWIRAQRAHSDHFIEVGATPAPAGHHTPAPGFLVVGSAAAAAADNTLGVADLDAPRPSTAISATLRVARVFLSHAGPDKPVVRRIAAALRAAGHDTWLDEDDILVGESIPAAVERGLGDADFVVLCLSKVAAERGWIEAERDATLMQQFREREERILPVRLEDVTPPGLVRALAHVDLFPDEQAFRRGIARLTHSIAAHAARRVTKGETTVVDSQTAAVAAIGAGPASGRPMARNVAPPTPAYLNAEVQALSEQLERARLRKQSLRDAGIETDEADRAILELRRKLRDGAQLRAGDALSDDRYLLVKQVGRGGFAVVWEAFDRAEQRRVAIKVLHHHLASDPQRRERFFRGARVMMDLQHPAVVRVLDPRGEDESFCYFVMELVPGGNLREAVLGNRVEAVRRLPLILQVGEALAEAHRKQLVHRDIKPANILLDEHGNAKLTDFDLVGAHDTTGGTRTGALGTVVYAAPECLDRPQDATARADVFGLGMTTIFCLAGHDLSMDTLVDRAGALAQLDCPESVRKVLERAVEWKSARRFADAAEMVVALRDALDDSAQSARANTDMEDDLDEAEFYAGQRMFSEAIDLLNTLLTRFPGHRLVLAKLREVEVLAAGGEVGLDVGSGGHAPAPGGTDAREVEVLAGGEVGLDVGSGGHAPAPGGTDAREVEVLDLDEIQATRAYQPPMMLEKLVDVDKIQATRAYQPTMMLEKPVDEGDVDTHYDLGLAYKEMALYDDAIKAFEKALRAPGREVGCRVMIGMCLREQGNPREAIHQFKQGLLAEPTERERQSLYYEIGFTYEAIRDDAEALYFFEMVVKHDPTFADAATRADRLRTRGGRATLSRDNDV